MNKSIVSTFFACALTLLPSVLYSGCRSCQVKRRNQAQASVPAPSPKTQQVLRGKGAQAIAILSRLATDGAAGIKAVILEDPVLMAIKGGLDLSRIPKNLPILLVLGSSKDAALNMFLLRIFLIEFNLNLSFLDVKKLDEADREYFIDKFLKNGKLG